MSVLITPTCPVSCEGVLVPVDFDLCAPEVHYGEVSKIYIAAVDAADFANIELLAEWTARLSETLVDPNAIRPLTVLGDLPVAEQTEISISGDRTIVGFKQFTLTFEIDETSSINYNFLLTSECNLTFKIWFETSDGQMYGGNEGIIASLRLNLMIPRERTDIVKYMGTLKWKSVFSPLRSLSPM
jgi:hypothetical protein